MVLLLDIFCPLGQFPVISDFLPLHRASRPDQNLLRPVIYKPYLPLSGKRGTLSIEQFVDQPVDDQALMQGAIRGMMDALGDKQTFYMEPKMYET